MNENLNLLEILKDCPKGTKLYSPVFGECTFENVTNDEEYPIRVTYKIKNNDTRFEYFTKNGFLYSNVTDTECMIFPSKDQRDWSKWHRPFVDGDILVYMFWRKPTIYIYREGGTHNTSYYVAYSSENNKLYTDATGALSSNRDGLRFANDEEKQKLFDIIKKNGYEWDSEKKELKTLQPFKDGDIIYNRVQKRICICHYRKDEKLCVSHCRYNVYHKTFEVLDNDICIAKQNYRLATEEEKQKLFKVIQENGYKWNPETKTLDKVKKEKFDPKILQPFDKVLVRDFDNQKWMACLFSHIENSAYHKFKTVAGLGWHQCIPFNNDTKHLVGKIDTTPKFYKYWEK